MSDLALLPILFAVVLFTVAFVDEAARRNRARRRRRNLTATRAALARAARGRRTPILDVARNGDDRRDA